MPEQTLLIYKDFLIFLNVHCTNVVLAMPLFGALYLSWNANYRAKFLIWLQ